MQEQDFVGEIMGFDPNNLDVFQKPEEKNYDQNVYKTNPVTTKVVSEDGHYRSKVKIIYNPFDPKRSVVNQLQYVMRDENGMFFVNSSLADGDKNCPIFKGWKKLWFSGDDAKKEFAKKMFDRNESQWVVVQIMEDDNRPDLVGQFKVMKLSRTVYNKMEAKMHPSVDSKKAPVALMDYLIGPVLDIDVTPGPDDPKMPSRKQREISYDLCDFDTDATPITKVDGSPLFDDEELELIESYATARSNFDKAKTDVKKAQYKSEIDSMAADVRNLYAKAIDYLKQYSVDLVAEKGFQPWNTMLETRVNNWLDKVTNMQDPVSSFSTTVEVEQVVPQSFEETTNSQTSTSVDVFASDEGLPF